MNVEFASVLLAGVSVGLSLAIGAWVLADRALPAGVRVVLVALVVSGAAYSLLVVTARPASGAGWRVLLVMASAPGPALLWLAVRLLFDDEFRVRAVALLPIAGLALLPLMRFVWFDARSLVPAILAGAAVAFGAHLVWRLFRGRRDDLDDYRRLLRSLFAGVGSVYLIVAVAGTLLVQPDRRGASFGVTLVSAQIAIKLALLALIAGRPSPLARLTAVPGPAARAPADPVDVVGASDGVDAADIATLVAAMEQGRVYRETSLTIGALARRVRMPEHRARQLINQGLGYRNFNAFLNHYRLREVAARLRDPAEARLPVLTLALDAGYGSIGPFNRAFRDAYGTTPTSYRRADSSAGRSGAA